MTSSNPPIKYFFVFPLLLLVAFTTCASPVRVESRGNAISRIMRTQPRKLSVSERFHDDESVRIEGWSDPDEVVQPLGHPGPKPPTIIKRVDLSTVEVPKRGLTDRQSKIEAQREQIENERTMLVAAHLFRDWEEKVEIMENGEKKTFVYIEILKMGVPSSEFPLSLLSEDQRPEARENGVKYLEQTFNVIVDPKYRNENKYFGFIDFHPPFAFPNMLRNAKLEDFE